MANNNSKNWDQEYSEAKGIPSSYKTEPSESLLWFLENLQFLSPKKNFPSSALDIGFGRGRNSIHLANLGLKVYAIDFSEKAFSEAQANAALFSLNKPEFLQHDLCEGLPYPDNFFDCAIDIFVYKHQLDNKIRKFYRQELKRVLRPKAKFLLSLAHEKDAYYSSCPPLNNSEMDVLDTETGVGSVLYNLESLQEEMSDFFELEMSWIKEKAGEMHGKTYLRKILNTIWRLK